MRAYLIAGAIAIAIIAIIVAIRSATMPDSSQGVSRIGDREARLPAGEKLILSYKPDNKNEQIWEVTYDGKDTVNFHCKGLVCSDLSGVLSCVDCNVTVDRGMFHREDFLISRRADGAARVAWPSGWRYYPPDS